MLKIVCRLVSSCFWNMKQNSYQIQFVFGSPKQFGLPVEFPFKQTPEDTHQPQLSFVWQKYEIVWIRMQFCCSGEAEVIFWVVGANLFLFFGSYLARSVHDVHVSEREQDCEWLVITKTERSRMILNMIFWELFFVANFPNLEIEFLLCDWINFSFGKIDFATIVFLGWLFVFHKKIKLDSKQQQNENVVSSSSQRIT